MPDLDDVAGHATRFEAMLDRAFRDRGLRDGLPPRLREAVARTPRHRFVHRYRVTGAVEDFDADPRAHLATVYSDQVLVHVDAAGRSLGSTNSQPSYVLWLLHLLELRPGDHVLEIGSGSGWLAAIIARLVGPDGRVTGVEIIDALAGRSRADLAACGIGNVTVEAADATGDPPGGQFDRVMITAGVWNLPAWLFDRVVEGGLVLAPVEPRGGGLATVAVLERRGVRFVARRSVGGAFVPLRGAGQTRETARRLSELPFWGRIDASPAHRRSLPLGTRSGEAVVVERAFRAYLSRTEPDFAVLATATSDDAFGLVDEAAASVAVCEAGELLGYGAAAAFERIGHAYVEWARCGLPGAGAFELEIARAGRAFGEHHRTWIEPRGDTVLVWRLKSDSDA